jgi:hypothetical protein
MKLVRDARLVIAALCLVVLSVQSLSAELGKVPVPGADSAGKAQNPAATDAIQVPVLEDPGVAAVLAANPLTPRERVRAADVLLRLNRPDLAKQMLEQVLKSPLDEATLLALDEEFGSATFFRFASHPELAPEGTNLATAVFDAVRKSRSDPGRLAGLVNDLCQSPNDRWYQVAEALIKAGPVVVPPLCEALLDPSKHAAWPRVYYVLGQFRPDADAALISLLLTVPDEKKSGVVGGIVALRITGTVPYLLPLAFGLDGKAEVAELGKRACEQLSGPLPTQRQAARILRTEIETILTQPVPQGSEVLSLLWWDSAANRVEARRVSFEMWRRERAAFLSEKAAQLVADDSELRDLASCLILEKIGYRERVEWGMNVPSEDSSGTPNLQKNDSRAVAVKASQALERWDPEIEDFNRWLGQCLAREWYHGAWVAVCWMRESGDAAGLLGRDVPPLIRAVQSSDPELRFVATDTVLKLAAGGTFRGASYVMKELAYFAASEGKAGALVADPVLSHANQIASYLKEIGYSRVDIVSDGGSLLDAAPRSPDYEIILVSAGIQRPPLNLTLQRLRAEPRLAGVPVLVYADPDWLPLADATVRGIPSALSVAVPSDPQDLAGLIARAKMVPTVRSVSIDQRLEWARAAMAWFLVFVEHPPEGISRTEIESAAISALEVPQLQELSLEILGQLATPKSQSALVEAVSRNDWPIALRVKALGAFRKAVEKRGVQLTTQQILQQYERYNQSTQSPPEVRKILGLILDYIEAPTQVQAVGIQAKE